MLINKNFTFLFLGTLISGIGSGLTVLGIAWVIQQLYNDYKALALLNTVGLIFAFIMLPKFSMWVDNYSKTGIAKALFLFGFIAQIIFIVMNEVTGLNLWLLVAVGIVSSLLSTLEPVNRAAIAKAVTTKAQYASTARLMELMQQLMTFIAGFIGILLIKKTNISYVLIVDALSFLLAFALMCCIKLEAHQSDHEKNNHSSGNLNVSIPGMGKAFYVFGAITLIPYVCIMAQRVIYPGHFETLLHASSIQYALYTLPYAIGAAIAIGAVKFINKTMDKYLSIFLGILFYAIAVLCIMIWPTLFITYAAFFMFSLCHCTIRINRLELLMHLVPLEYFGRVSGRFQSFSSMMIVFLSWLPAIIMNSYGITSGWLIFAAASIMPVVIYLSYLKSIKTTTQSFECKTVA